MAYGFKEIVTTGIWIALITVLGITAVILIADEYDLPPTAVSSDLLQFTALNDTLTDIQEDAEGWKDSFEKGNLFSVLVGLVYEGIWDIAKLMFTSVVTFAVVFLDIVVSIFNLSPIIVGSIVGIIIISVMLAIWRLIKMGE